MVADTDLRIGRRLEPLSSPGEASLVNSWASLVNPWVGPVNYRLGLVNYWVSLKVYKWMRSSITQGELIVDALSNTDTVRFCSERNCHPDGDSPCK